MYIFYEFSIYVLVKVNPYLTIQYIRPIIVPQIVIKFQTKFIRNSDYEPKTIVPIYFYLSCLFFCMSLNANMISMRKNWEDSSINVNPRHELIYLNKSDPNPMIRKTSSVMKRGPIR